MFYRILVCYYCCVGIGFGLDFAQIEGYLSQNPKIKQLEYEIKALESQAKAESKWDNPILSIGYNNAEVLRPFRLDTSAMQNIGIGLLQNLDINGKKSLQSHITTQKSLQKILELKNTKNQYMFALINEAVITQKNLKILALIEDSLMNIDTLLQSFGKSSNFDSAQFQKLNLLKAKLTIKQNQVKNELANAHISTSQISLEQINSIPIDVIEIPLSQIDSLDSSIIDTILESNYEIQIAKLQDAISLDSVHLAKKAYIADLGLGVSYMFRVGMGDMFGIALSMPMPIYGKEKHQILQAKAQSSIAKSEIVDIQNKIKHQSKSLLERIQTLKSNLLVVDTILLPSSKSITTLYRHHSISQSGAFLEFYNALNEQIESEMLRLEILSDMSSAYWNLMSLKGK